MVVENKTYKQIVTDILRDLRKRSPLTDTNIGSVSRTIIETVSLEIAGLYDQLEAAYQAGFVDTAEGPALDLVVAILGIERKSAQFATGSVTFSRRSANRDVSIPRGTRVSTRTADPTKVKVFETTMNENLPKGEAEAEVPIRALLPGEDGEADLETITDIDSPIVGVDSVNNKKPTNVGAEEESDEELRERAKATVLSAGKTTVNAIHNAVLSIPGVRSVNVYDMPNGIPGEIDIIIDGLDLSDEESAEYLQVQEVVRTHRPVGIQVNIKSVELVKADLEIYTKLYEKTRTDEELQDAINTIENAVINYVNALKAGETVLKNRIIQAVVNVDDVYNIDDIIVTTKVFDEQLGGMLDDTRHRVDPNTKDVNIANEERATIDNLKVITQYTPRLVSYVQIDLDLEIVPSHKTVTKRQLQNRIESSIHVHIERLRSGEEIDYKRMFNIISNIEGVLEIRRFTIDALHEETGLIIKEAEENIKIFEDETPKLRDVELELLDVQATASEGEEATAKA